MSVGRAVLDASAFFAYSRGEAGGDAVRDVLGGAAMSSANWAEVAQHTIRRGDNLTRLRGIVRGVGLTILSFGEADAERTATLWPRTKHKGLSLADRACLALAERLGAPAYTADRAWADLDVGIEIRFVR